MIRRIIIVSIFMLLMGLGPIYSQIVGRAYRCELDTVSRTYPERLFKEFPVIFKDTAYSSHDYHVLIRCVWTAERSRKVIIVEPELLPCPADSEMVRFTIDRSTDSELHVNDDSCYDKANSHIHAIDRHKK